MVVIKRMVYTIQVMPHGEKCRQGCNSPLCHVIVARIGHTEMSVSYFNFEVYISITIEHTWAGR